RHQWKLDAAAAVGLDHGVLAPTPLDAFAFATTINDLSGPCDVVVDLAGGPYVEVDVHAGALKGRIVLVGTVSGGTARLPVNVVMGKRLTIVGTVLRARSDDEKAAATDAFAADVGPLL